MKKAFLTLLSIFLIFQAAFSVSAASDISFRISETECKINRLIEVDMLSACDKKLSAAIFEIYYDKSILEFRKASVPSESKIRYNVTDECVRISYLCTYGADISTESSIFTLTFKSISNGSTDIGFSVFDCVDSDIQSMSVGACTSGRVTVTEKATESADKAETSKSSDKSKSSSSGKTSSVKSSKAESEEIEEESRTDVNDFGKINDVVQQDADKITPIIVLCFTAIVVICIAGYFLFKLRQKNIAKKHGEKDKNEESPD